MTNKIFSVYFSLIILVTGKLLAQNSPDVNFLFPIDINPIVSGSFAELRNNHFHSGIDLSTNGKTGIPVKSMEEGVISRIKVSPVGYGNAIYIKHANGYTTVYGHLKKYSKKITTIITAAQYDKESFAIDYFPTEEISINRGEIIGYTGNSGSSGGPHLHYEIRDTETEKPINPFLFQSKIKDDIRPKLLNIRIYPLGDESSVNGEPSARLYPVVFYDGAFHLKSNPKIYGTGKIGIGIEMLDYMSGSWKKCGVYKLDMYANGKKWYGWELERFSFYESRYINSHIDYGYKKAHGKRFERCYRQPNNKLSVYNKIQNDGVINMDSTIKVKIVATDAANNKSNLSFKIYKGNWNKSKIQSAPKINSTQLKYTQEHLISKENITCSIPQGALYDDIDFELKELSPYNGFPLYQIGDDKIPLHLNSSITIKIPDSLKKYNNNLTLASLNGNGNKKTYYAGGVIKNETIELKTKYFGKYTFAIDTIPPTIKSSQSIKGRTFNKNSRLVFKINDNFSGIKSYNGYLNGKWTLFEYDAKTHSLVCPLNKAPIKIGAVQLKLDVADNCGNSKIYKSEFFFK